jgi:hypothetical protein
VYIVNRTRVAKPGKMGDAIASFQASRRLVQRFTGRELLLAAPVFGQRPGTLTMALVVEGRADWFDVLDRLRSDAEAVELEQRTDCFEGPGEDSIRAVLHLGGVDPTKTDERAFVQWWTSQIDHFRFDDAMAWAIGVADHVTGLTSVPVAVAADAYGDFGTIAWIASLRSAQQGDAMNEAMLGDATWRKMLADADGLFVPASTKVWLNRTIP